MKKYLFPIAILFFFSCSKDESEEPTPTPNPIVEQFNLTVNADEGGTVSSSGGKYDKGTEVTLSATPDAEFLFTGWSNGATDNPLKLTINSNLEITANFEKRKYALTVEIEGDGTVKEEIVNAGKTTTEYTSGSIIRLTAEPSEEWVFVAWNGTVESSENPLEITIDKPNELTATFEKRKYPLTITIEGEGEVTEEIVNSGRSTDYDSGTTVKLTAEPLGEWSFIGWNGAVESTENPIEITLTEATQITATFELVQYELTVNSGEGGQVDSDGGVYDSGTELTLTASPNDGYIFSHWSDDSEENPRTITVDSDKELTALFKDKFEIEDGFYIFVGVVDDNGEPVFYDANPFVFEYVNNEAIFAGTVYEDLASFPIFKDLGYVPGAGDPDENLVNLFISRYVLHREYYTGGNRVSYLLQKIEEEDIPHKKTHEEIMALVEGKGFWSDPIYAEIDPLVPETYVLAFLKDAERHGLDLSFVDVDKILVEFRNEGFAGLSHLSCIDDDRVHISYYTPFWNSASYFDIQNERLTVMYHELGHDILNSGHPATGDMKQFMNQALGDVGPIVWDDSNPMFSFRRMVDDMFSGVGLDYPCTNGATDYTNGSSGKFGNSGKSVEHCFTNMYRPQFSGY